MRSIILSIVLSALTAGGFAQKLQEQGDVKYRRSSLYSMLVTHPSLKFNKEIEDVFVGIPLPEKFNNHNLSVRVVSSDTKKQEDKGVIDNFVTRNDIARRMVAKWYDRDPETGHFNLGLIASRGYYDASAFDVNVARSSVRGIAALADAGEELIGNTFLIVNDIKYVDKEQGAKVAGAGLKLLGALASAYTGDDTWSTIGNVAGSIVETIKGFRVTVTSYLYRLEWDEEIANHLYTAYYMTDADFDAQRKAEFDRSKNFRLKYVGEQAVNSGNTSVMGVNLDAPEIMIRKVCTRALDKSIAQLQLAHEEFRVKTPIYRVGETVQAMIGMKEDVSADSKFEVLERSVDKNGKTQYKRVGIIQPIPGKIWDNRYMAAEEKAAGSELTYTEFKKTSGGDFYPGMLIREIK